MKKNFTYILALFIIATLGLFTAVAIAGNGHQNKPGDDTTAECQPAHGGESCVHNGDGHGNCGDNRGKGSHGNDNGFGHKHDACQASTTTTTKATTTVTNNTTTTVINNSTITLTTPGQTVTTSAPPAQKTTRPNRIARPATPVKTPANFTG